MAPIIERNFPRGGDQRVINQANEKEKIVFGASQLKKNASKKRKKPEPGTENEDENSLQITSAALLNYQTIEEGMLIMGIVKSLDQINIKISLPGRIIVKIDALCISNAYTKMVKKLVDDPNTAESYKPLTELYDIGRIVYGKVMTVRHSDDGHTNINFSLKPCDVHSELIHTNIKKGFVFNGAIQEVQEHGYIIETGISDLRCFLPIENSKAGHAVGELVFMKVVELSSHPSATTIRCKELDQERLKVKEQISPNLDYLLPGTIVPFTVEKQLKNGLQGTMTNGLFTGYVNEHNLPEPLNFVDDIEINSTLPGRILYVAPLTKVVYLSLDLFNSNEHGNAYEAGDVKSALVHHVGSSGIVMIIKGKHKGIVPIKAIKSKVTGNYDMDQILNKYGKKTKHKVRILDYELIGGFYVCTDDPAIVNEKVFSVKDLAVGEFVTASVVASDPKVGGYSLRIGQAYGIIERIFLSSSTPQLGANAKLKCRITAIHPSRNLVYTTNLPEYMAKDAKVLTNLEAVSPKSIFLGTIIKCGERFYIVKFFHDFKGILYRTSVNGSRNLYEGQTMHFCVTTVTKNNIILGLPEDTFEIGECCSGSVTLITDSCLEVLLQSKHDNGYSMRSLIPSRLLTEFQELSEPALRTYNIGETVTVCCIAKNVFSVRDVPYLNEKCLDWKSVQKGSIMRAFVCNVEGDVLEISIPILGCNKTVKLHRNMLVIKSVAQQNIVFHPEQVIYVQVLTKDTTTKLLGVSAKLTAVWNGDFAKTGEYVARYIKEVQTIKKRMKAQGQPLAKIAIGTTVSATYKSQNEDTGDWLLELDQHKVPGIIKASLLSKANAPTEGATIECVVLWVDYQDEVVYLSSNSIHIDKITKGKVIPPQLVRKTGINAKVLLKTHSLLICCLQKGTNPLVYVPTRLYYNDFCGDSTAQVKEGDFCKLCFIYDNHPIAVLEDTYKLWHGSQNFKRLLKQLTDDGPQDKKSKINGKEMKGRFVCLKLEDQQSAVSDTERESDHQPIQWSQCSPLKQNKPKTQSDKFSSIEREDVKENKKMKPSQRRTVVVDNPSMFFEDRERDIELLNESHVGHKRPLQSTHPEVAQTSSKECDKRKEDDETQLKLPGVENFWNINLKDEKLEDDTSGDEVDPASVVPTKKKRLTAAQKLKAAKKEEARIREIEEKYADPNHIPETVDEFDRLALGQPNNSKNWINYMVFHLQAVELDKARAVARRALKTISFRESEDILNIWVALLNLELRYGTKETYNEVFTEAVLCNDQYSIYTRLLQILTHAKKIQDLTQLIAVVIKKFKDNLEMWKSCTIALYKSGLSEQADRMLHKALAVLPEREHVSAIVMFANLTHKYSNSPEVAHALLDQVVTSYPKRVDVWSQYVDMLIKDNQIESARNILGRAVIQKIPVKKMRTIFTKYQAFEERYGTEHDVERVKLLAESYIKRNSI